MVADGGGISGRVDDIRETLRRCAEDLNELSMAVLRDAIEEGESRRPEIEKHISKARRTVERAIAQLSGADSQTSDD